MLLTQPFAILLQSMASSCLPLQILDHIWQHVVVKGLSSLLAARGLVRQSNDTQLILHNCKHFRNKFLHLLHFESFFLVTTLQLKELVVGNPLLVLSTTDVDHNKSNHF